MKSGFTLIEVMVTLAISALMLTALYQALSQTGHITRRTDERVDYGTLLVILCNQLEKDISSAFFPISRADTAPDTQQMSGAQTPKPLVKEEEKKDEKFFFGEKNKEGSTSLFTCITTNRLAVYGQDKPSLARVVYNLVPDKKNEKPGVFKLTRQESSKLDLKTFKDGKQVRAYTIAESLKKFKCTYLVFPVKEENKQGQTLTNTGPAAAEKVSEQQEKIESFDAWNEEIQKKTKRQTPDFVQIEGAFWDTAKKRELPFSLKIPVLAQYRDPDKKQEQAQPASPMQEQLPAVQYPQQAAPQPQLLAQELTLNVVPKEQLALKLLPHQKITVNIMPDGGREIRA